MCYVTFVNSLPYKAMRRLGKHTTYEFQTHVELDAPSVLLVKLSIYTGTIYKPVIKINSPVQLNGLPCMVTRKIVWTHKQYEKCRLRLCLLASH